MKENGRIIAGDYSANKARKSLCYGVWNKRNLLNRSLYVVLAPARYGKLPEKVKVKMTERSIGKVNLQKAVSIAIIGFPPSDRKYNTDKTGVNGKKIGYIFGVKPLIAIS